MLDTGVDTSHPDLQDTRFEWDLAVDVKMERADDDGTCRLSMRDGWKLRGHYTASLIGGSLLGAASFGDYEDQPNCCFDAQWPWQSRNRNTKTSRGKPEL